MNTHGPEDTAMNILEMERGGIAPSLTSIYADLHSIVQRGQLQNPALFVAHGIREIQNAIVRDFSRIEDLQSESSRRVAGRFHELAASVGDASATAEESDSIRLDGGKAGEGARRRTAPAMDSQRRSETDAASRFRCPHDGRKCISHNMKQEDNKRRVERMYRFVWRQDMNDQVIQFHVRIWMDLHDKVMAVVHAPTDSHDSDGAELLMVNEWILQLEALLSPLYQSFLPDLETIHEILDEANK